MPVGNSTTFSLGPEIRNPFVSGMRSGVGPCLCGVSMDSSVDEARQRIDSKVPSSDHSGSIIVHPSKMIQESSAK